MNKKNIFIWIFRITVACVLVYLLFFKIGIRTILETLQAVNGYFLIIAAVFFLATILIGGYKLFLFFPEHPNFLKFIKTYLYSIVIGNLSPARIGDFSLVYFLDGNKTLDSAKIVLDKAITFYINFMVGLIAILMILGGNWRLYLIALIIGVSPVMFFFLNKKVISKIMVITSSNKFLTHIQKNYVLLNKFIKENYFTIAKSMGVAIVRMGLNSMAIFFIFLSLGTAISISKVIFITGLYIVIAALPVSIQGFGLGELTSIEVLVKFGIDYRIGFAMNIINALLLYSFSLVWVILFKPKKSHKTPVEIESEKE